MSQPMSDGEAQALRRFLPILSRIATLPERRQIALNIERRISGEDRGLMALSFRQLAALFYPADDARAEAFAQALQAARTAGTLTSIVPSEQGGILVADLAIWPDCPPLPADSPLQYWLPGMPLEGEQPPEECTPPKSEVQGASPGLGTSKVWTPERLNELRDYRTTHGTKAAAKKFKISTARIRELLPSGVPAKKGYSAFTFGRK